jgi:hypothetical protein
VRISASRGISKASSEGLVAIAIWANIPGFK